MRDGFIKVAAVTPDIRVADCEYNAEQICKKMKEAAALGSKIIVFPELGITGYTCSDLFRQDILLDRAGAFAGGLRAGHRAHRQRRYRPLERARGFPGVLRAHRAGVLLL